MWNYVSCTQKIFLRVSSTLLVKSEKSFKSEKSVKSEKSEKSKGPQMGIC